MDKENIEDFIQFFAEDKIIERGKELLRDNVISLSHYTKKTDTLHFKVKGTKLYTVRIKNLLNNNINASCSCPYNWGGICKHTVAVLYDIIENRDESIFIEKSQTQLVIHEKRDASPFVIDNYKIVDSRFIAKYLKNQSMFVFSDYSLKKMYFKQNLLQFDVTKEKNYSQIENFRVELYYKDNTFYINSNQNRAVPKGYLKVSEAFILNWLSTFNFSKVVSSYFINKQAIKEQTCKKYGISLKQFNKYFEYAFSRDNGIVIKQKTNGLLIPVDENEQVKSTLTNIQNFNLDSLIENIASQNKILRIGFVIKEEINRFDYVIIFAKPNKARTKLISRFDVYNEYEDEEIHFLDGEKELIEKIEQFDVFDDEQELSQAFTLSKQIFKVLQEQKFVYFQKYDHGYDNDITKYSLTKIKISNQTVRIIVKIKQDNNFIYTEYKYLIDGEYVDVDKVTVDYKLLYYKDKIYHLNSVKDWMLFFNFKQGMKMVKEHKETFYQQVIKPLSKDFELVFDKGVYCHNKIELDYKKEQIYISEKDNYIIIKPQVVYDNNVSVLLMHNGNYIKKDDSGSINEYVRNTELESVFLEQIAALHPDFQDQKENNFFYLHIDKFTKDLWFYKFFDKLNAADVEIFGLKELKKLKYSPYKGKVSFGIRSGQDWFDVSINVSFGNNKVSLSDIKKAVVNQQKYIQLKDGSVGILPEEWLHKFEKYFRNGNVQKNELRISKLRFSIIDELFDNIDDEKLLKELAEKKKRISNFTQISKTKVPDEIKAELRPYQKEGLNWLNFLDEMKWGGILADDMGLGKTLQILTFIQHISKSDKTPNLIVIPTTLLFNWKAEIEKFAPKIKSYFHYGIDRQKDTKNFKAKNIIFTSYGIMMRDIEYLKDFLFNYVILDESQAIKNPTSRRYKAANLLQAKNKIAMTGTPIENSTFDLFAQMNFVNPGMFGSIKSFKENYSNPIDKEGNEMVANELQKVIHPFVLRRTKENVAKELPPKVEDIIYCEMEPAQRQVYDAYRNTYRNKLLKQVEEKGIGQSKMMVLEALTRLRQICDSPALIDEVDYDEKSIKIKEIVEHIIHKTAKHKVLIFSQFVKMLGLIKEELIRLNIPFEYLDGKSSLSQREQSVNSFQNDPKLRVFLISLRAGGTGLNLTAADYVYIMDPWWNPAVENQAIDRTYRIGQDKSVFAYRMICKNTVEEKILDLQAKKIKIATDIIHTDENIMKNLSVTDINDLFG